MINSKASEHRPSIFPILIRMLYDFLQLKCPECQSRIDKTTLSCENDHVFNEQDGVVTLFTQEFNDTFEYYLKSLNTYREDWSTVVRDPKQFDQLPNANIPGQEKMWEQRHNEMLFIRKALHSQEGLKVLEVGAWNGWLSNKLMWDRHAVVAVDYFDDEWDGLRAKKHYPHPNWASLQMDPEHPEIIDSKFDVIIFNHNLPYFSDLEKTLKQYKAMLNTGGKFFIIGIHIVGDPKKYEAAFKAKDADFQNRFGISINFKPMKPCLTKEDKALLQAEGFHLHIESKSILKSLKQKIKKEEMEYMNAIYQS